MTTAISSSERWFSAPPVGAGCGRRWLIALIVLLLATLVGAPARAAVPMCSEDGRTVAAPPIILPWRGLTLDAPVPCPQPDNLLLVKSLPDQRAPSSAPTPAPLRAVPVRPLDIPAAPALREPLITADHPTSLELVNTVYRPPRD
jgi:hypothetical protein